MTEKEKNIKLYFKFKNMFIKLYNMKKTFSILFTLIFLVVIIILNLKLINTLIYSYFSFKYDLDKKVLDYLTNFISNHWGIDASIIFIILIYSINYQLIHRFIKKSYNNITSIELKKDDNNGDYKLINKHKDNVNVKLLITIMSTVIGVVIFIGKQLIPYITKYFGEKLATNMIIGLIVSLCSFLFFFFIIALMGYTIYKSFHLFHLRIIIMMITLFLAIMISFRSSADIFNSIINYNYSKNDYPISKLYKSSNLQYTYFTNEGLKNKKEAIPK